MDEDGKREGIKAVCCLEMDGWKYISSNFPLLRERKTRKKKLRI